MKEKNWLTIEEAIKEKVYTKDQLKTLKICLDLKKQALFKTKYSVDIDILVNDKNQVKTMVNYNGNVVAESIVLERVDKENKQVDILGNAVADMTTKFSSKKSLGELEEKLKGNPLEKKFKKNWNLNKEYDNEDWTNSSDVVKNTLIDAVRYIHMITMNDFFEKIAKENNCNVEYNILHKHTLPVQSKTFLTLPTVYELKMRKDKEIKLVQLSNMRGCNTIMTNKKGKETERAGGVGSYKYDTKIVGPEDLLSDHKLRGLGDLLTAVTCKKYDLMEIREIFEKSVHTLKNKNVIDKDEALKNIQVFNKVLINEIKKVESISLEEINTDENEENYKLKFDLPEKDIKLIYDVETEKVIIECGENAGQIDIQRYREAIKKSKNIVDKAFSVDVEL